jgi:hypothetical protein
VAGLIQAALIAMAAAAVASLGSWILLPLAAICAGSTWFYGRN